MSRGKNFSSHFPERMRTFLSRPGRRYAKTGINYFPDCKTTSRCIIDFVILSRECRILERHKSLINAGLNDVAFSQEMCSNISLNVVAKGAILEVLWNTVLSLFLDVLRKLLMYCVSLAEAPGRRHQPVFRLPKALWRNATKQAIILAHSWRGTECNQHLLVYGSCSK